MSSAADLHPANADHDHILRPRPTKPLNAQLLRAHGSDGTMKPSGTHSETSSGRSTPLPPDAPPSQRSISYVRRQVRAQPKRLFPTIDYAARVSHFDRNSDYRDFRGFFSLFWIGLAIMVITTMLRNVKDTGHPLRRQIWSLLTEKVWQLGLSDLAMVASTGVSLPLQLWVRRNGLRWSRGGMAIQSLYQLAWLVFWVAWPFLQDWAWTAQVYFTLHALALLMKMHSYAFYNGHLSETERRLSALDTPATASKAPADRYPTAQSSPPKPDDVGSGTEEEKEKDADDKSSLTSLREDLALELVSPLGRVTYPQNLTASNYVDYLLCPTLCYELEYPRTSKIDYLELAWKTLAVFGCIFLLTVTSEEFILPVLRESSGRLEGTHQGLVDKGLILAETISMLLFPFMICFLLVFLVIFEYVLGAFAEITRFADRQFYEDWWNSTDWLEFSREWNIPVHNFFRRHVYLSSRSAHLSRPTATALTFLISALAHELVMGCMTKKFRGYGLVAMMLQLPIVALQRMRWVRGRRVLNMCALYVLI
ncbi:MAG: hypothetical protein M1817_004881 [Caeruleum heppii]|nr:MAG: hypothetical protein M1817_004881 [Caeruleum heppii]